MADFNLDFRFICGACWFHPLHVSTFYFHLYYLHIRINNCLRNKMWSLMCLLLFCFQWGSIVLHLCPLLCRHAHTHTHTLPLGSPTFMIRFDLDRPLTKHLFMEKRGFARSFVSLWRGNYHEVSIAVILVSELCFRSFPLPRTYCFSKKWKSSLFNCEKYYIPWNLVLA